MNDIKKIKEKLAVAVQKSDEYHAMVYGHYEPKYKPKLKYWINEQKKLRKELVRLYGDINNN
jgi:hypothetical protein